MLPSNSGYLRSIGKLETWKEGSLVLLFVFVFVSVCLCAQLTVIYVCNSCMCMSA